jgi:hypothetical protein
MIQALKSMLVERGVKTTAAGGDHEGDEFPRDARWPFFVQWSEREPVR